MKIAFINFMKDKTLFLLLKPLLEKTYEIKNTEILKDN